LQSRTWVDVHNLLNESMIGETIISWI